MTTLRQLRLVAAETISLWRRDPLRMMCATASQLVGDREAAQYHLTKIKEHDLALSPTGSAE